MVDDPLMAPPSWFSLALNMFLWGAVFTFVLKISRESLAELGYDDRHGKKVVGTTRVDSALKILFNVLDSVVLAWENVLFKSLITTYSGLFMVFSQEGKRPSDNQPRLTPSNSRIVGTRTIYLLRHGESMWNLGVNRGFNAGILYRFLYLFSWESRLCLSRDSVFIDSPLSDLGVQQSLATKNYIDSLDINSSDGKALKGTEPNECAILVSSNLRRAMSTVMIACNSRLSVNPLDCIFVNSDLQEMTRNIDGISLSQRRHNTNVSSRETKDASLKKSPLAVSLDDCYRYRVNGISNKGNKGIGSKFYQRLQSVCSWIFSLQTATGPNLDSVEGSCFSQKGNNPVLLSGHSLFFRQLLKDTLPEEFDHPVKTGKISNGGLVRFEMIKLEQDGRIGYYVPPETFVVLTGKVEAKKTKSSSKISPKDQ